MGNIEPTESEKALMKLFSERGIYVTDLPDDFISKWCLVCFKPLTDADTEEISLGDGRYGRECQACVKEEEENDDDLSNNEDYAGIDISELN